MTNLANGRYRRLLLSMACFVAAIGLVCSAGDAHAFKRRPTGRDWIGGDFADPATMIFRHGLHGGGFRRRLGGSVQQVDAPPPLLDRLEIRAPANYGANTRKSLGAGIQRFEIVGGKVAYGLDGSGRLWRYALGTTDATMVAQSVAKFRASEAGPLYVLESDGTLWQAEGDGSNRVFLDHQVAEFQPVAGVVYVTGRDKRLWRLRDGGKSRDWVDDNVAAFQAIDSTIVFVLGTDGILWREVGDMHTRTNVAQPVAAFQYVAAGDTAYVLTPNHVLWRQRAGGSPEQVDHDVAAFQAVDMNIVYVLATDGRLWQERKDRAQALLVDGDVALNMAAAAFQFAGSTDDGAQLVYFIDRRHELWAETMPARGGER